MNARYLALLALVAMLPACFLGCGDECDECVCDDDDDSGDDDVGDDDAGDDDAEEPTNYVVGAHYYPWYNTDSHHWVDPSYERTHLLDPYLGEYHCGDPEVAEQQIDWAADYGVDVLTLEWWGPDTYGVDNLNTGFFQAPNLERIRFIIFYDTMIRMSPFVGGWSMDIDFSREDVRETFINDVIGIAETYFEHERYFNISDRPVMWMYWTIGYTGDFAGAVLEARIELLARGYDLYLVGDFAIPNLKPGLIPLFDAVSVYCPWQRFLFLPFDTSDIGHFADVLEVHFRQTGEWVTQIPVAGRTDGATVDFHPGVIPQFDDSWMVGFPREFNSPILASSRDDVLKMFRMARETSEPAYDTDLHVVWITSFNEWHETTTIEPTIIDEEPKYPLGNYGFDFLEAVQEVFEDNP